MKQALGMLRALGVLLAIWAVLFAVGVIAGVVPSFGGGGAAERDVPPPPAASDGGAPLPDATAATVEAAVDAGPGEEPAAPAPAVETLARFAVCDASARMPEITAAQIVGSPTAELAVGCHGVVHAIAGEPEGGAIRPLRIVTFDAQGEGNATQALSAGPIAAGDVDGDSLPDLVLPFWQPTEEGATRGGRVYLVRREASGAFADPRLLAPIAAGDAALAQLDARPGLDIVALNRGSELARRPSEAWVFSGGAAPLRTAVLRGGLGGRAVALADLDGNGHADVIMATKDDPRVDVFRGDGTGRFPESASVTVPGATELTVADVDGDGAVDALVRGDGLHLIRGGQAEALVALPIDAPPGFHDIHPVAREGDARRDLLGLAGGALVALRQSQPMTWEEARLLTLSGIPMHRLAIADLTGDGVLDGAVLVRGEGEAGAWELVLIPDIARARPLAPSAEASRLRDAPLVLRVALN